MTYADHQAFLERQRDGFDAELDGFLAASYAPTCPGHWYADKPELRRRFELGYANGAALKGQS